MSYFGITKYSRSSFSNFNRIMVGLPSVENREMIMKTLLAKEKVDEGLDFKELATMTEGYSGSDLKVVIPIFALVFEYIIS